MREKEQRNEKIVALRKAGKTYREIGDMFKLSRQRIDQICKIEKKLQIASETKEVIQELLKNDKAIEKAIEDVEKK